MNVHGNIQIDDCKKYSEILQKEIQREVQDKTKMELYISFFT